MERRFRDSKGFTIVEVLAAMILLSIVAVPLARTFIDGFKFKARGQVKTEANKVIEYVTEQLKNENYFDVDFEDSIKKFAKGELASVNTEVKSDSILGGNISSDYSISIKRVSAVQVQEGGVGTPESYELEIDLLESYVNNNTFLDVRYSGVSTADDGSKTGMIYIDGTKIGAVNFDMVGEPPVQEDFYAVRLKNCSDDEITIDVRKQIEDKVKFYTVGEIKLRQYADPGLSQLQKTFKIIKLGDKTELDDETEYLCEAIITATNRNDETVTSSMNVTFSVFIPNE